MIEIKALFYKYPNAPSPLFKDINLQIDPGTLSLITGSSGSGKSTLLRCLNGLIPHFSGGKISGSINVFGSNPIKDGPEKLASKIGFVFQEPESQFIFDVVEDEIAFSLENMGIPWREMHDRVDKVINYMGLSSIRTNQIHQISGGEKQKVAIASVLVTKPRVLLLDEPTSQLDPLSADQILRLCVSMKKELGLTIIISEHRLERLLPYTDNVIHIRKDHSITTGSPKKIIPNIEAVPPVVEIAKLLQLETTPLTPDDFPPFTLKVSAWQDEKNFNNNQNQPQHEPVLSLKNLKTSFNQKDILKDIRLNVRSGEILVLLGLNASGKTTLLRSILGLVSSTGKRLLDGQEMDVLPLPKIIEKIAYLPQNPNDLLFAETVLDELKITLKNHGLNENNAFLNKFLENFGLREKKGFYPRDLSVGERQRVALAAITVHDPKIILLDEPTRGLDYLTKDNLIQLIKRWRDKGKGIILVTHDVEFAAKLADIVAILESGKIIFTGQPRTAFTQFPNFQTQTARIFPNKGWIIPEDVPKAGLVSRLT